jgi:hypothetical protein
MKDKRIKGLFKFLIKANYLGEKPGLVVKADGSRSRGRGFEPWHRILDGCKRC